MKKLLIILFFPIYLFPKSGGGLALLSLYDNDLNVVEYNNPSISFRDFYVFSDNLKKEPIKHEINLKEYEIINPNFIPILDSFINAEKICDYYTDSMYLSIDICDWNGSLEDSCKESDTLSVTISSVATKPVLFHLAVGYFKYKNHLIVISNFASSQIFKTTGLEKLFFYKVDELDTDKDHILRIPFFEDDSYTYWTYKYLNGVFSISHEKLNCPSRRIE